MKMGKLDWRGIRMPAETSLQAIAKPRLEVAVAVSGSRILCYNWIWVGTRSCNGFDLVGPLVSGDFINGNEFKTFSLPVLVSAC